MAKKQKTQKRQKWVKLRHRIISSLASLVLRPYITLKYHVKIERFKEQNGRQYCIVMNHQTAFDQFFIGLAFKGPVYYVASEDLFSNGFISKLLRWAVAPIPIKKQATDIGAVRTCMRVAKEGGTIALAPEGNRTYSGKTGYMKSAIVGFVRVLKLPLALFRIEGGYGVQPRWSDTVRKGKMRTYVSKVIEPEEYKNMTDEELLAVIEEGLYVDEGCVDGEYRHKRAAEYLDRAMYVCPDCGLSIFHSEKDIIECKRCGKKIRYLPTKELQGVNCDFPFRFTTEWYDYQCEYVSNLDLSQFGDKPIYEDETKLFEVVLYKKKKRMAKSAKVSLYQDRLTLTTDKEKIEMPFKDTHVITVLGRNKLNIYFGDKIYQLKGDKHFNALKYMNLYYRKINQESGEDDKFLGI